MTKILRFAAIAAMCLVGVCLASAQYTQPSNPNYGNNKIGLCYSSTINNWIGINNTTANKNAYPITCDQYGNLTIPTGFFLPLSGGTLTGALTITPVTNQILLGTTNVTTFSTGSPAASATVNLPTVAGGVASASPCGTAVGCTAAAATPNVITKYGTAPLTSGSPSTASITGLPFTSSTSYTCTASPQGTTAAIAAGGVAVNQTSGSAMTLTGPNTVSTVIQFICVGT